MSELIRREPDRTVVARFEEVPDEGLFTSAICVEEVAFGARSAEPGNRIWERFESKVLPALTVLAFDQKAALAGGSMRGTRRLQGTPMDYADALIAATALAHGLTLATRNTRHFGAIPGLTVENWFEPRS